MSNNERTVMFQLPSVLAGQLACVAGSVAGRSWELSAGTFTIGRREGSDLYLVNEPGVSKLHAKIVAEGDQYVLEDAESRNGTIVNGKPIRRVELKDGDLIQVCGCKLRFSIASQNAATEALPVQTHSAESIEATVVSAPNPFMSDGEHDLPPPPIDDDVSDLDPSTMEIASSLAGEAALPRPPSAGAAVIEAPLFDIAAADGAIPPPPPGTEEISLKDAFVAQPTEISTPFTVAPGAPAPRSALPWFVGGLFMALISGGGAYAAALFVNDGVLPTAAGTAVAMNTAGEDNANAPADGAGTPGTDPAPSDGTAPKDGAQVGADNDGAAATTGEEADPATDGTGDDAPGEDDTGDQPSDDGAKDPAAADDEPASDTEVDDEIDDGLDDPPAATTSGATKRRSARTSTKTADADASPKAASSSTSSAATSSGPKWTPVNISAAAGKSVPFTAPSAGKIGALKKSAGAQVNKGQTIATMGGGDEQLIARLERSVKSLEEVVAGSGSEEAAAMLAQEKKRLSAAKKGGGRLIAPISGKLASLDIKVGDSVNAGQNVGMIDGRASTTVYATVAKTSAKPGSTVTLKRKSGGTVKGRVVNKTKAGRRYTVVIEPKGASPSDIASVQLP